MSKYETDYTCGNNAMFVDRARWIKSFLPEKNATVCDIGCGNGQLLLELHKLGFTDLFALDPSPQCIAAIKAKGINGLAGTIFNVPLGKKFDAVILSGVLEHICDISGFMHSICSIIRPGGILFVFVPDASRYADYDNIPYDYFNIEHINHFEEVSLINLGLAYKLSVVGLLKAEISFESISQPVIFCAYRNNDEVETEWIDHLLTEIRRYLSKTGASRKTDEIIDSLVESNKKIVVWGAGNYVSRLLAGSRLGQCDILMFVDNDKNKQGNVIRGRLVRAPEVLLAEGKECIIVTAVAVFSDEVLAQIRSMGLNNRVIVLK
jgi:SAM-dependent methyltransferase